jgi:ABC-2 type transport system ATP-binding protein
VTTAGVTVSLERVTRRFGGAAAVDDVTFRVGPGEVVGLLGPNGAGKTTTMRLLTGYLRATSGTVTVDGGDPADDRSGVRQLVGYVPEQSALYGDMSVLAYVRFWARLRGVPRGDRAAAVDAALADAGVEKWARQRIATLSRGLRQRVAIAQSLVHRPQVLVLDEPTSGLDPRQVSETRALISRLGRTRTVLLSSHVLNEVSELCARVVVLDKGKVIADREVAALRGGGTLEEAYLRLVRE